MLPVLVGTWEDWRTPERRGRARCACTWYPRVSTRSARLPWTNDKSNLNCRSIAILSEMAVILYIIRLSLFFVIFLFFCIQPPFLIPNPTNFLSSSPTFFLTSSFRRSVTLDITWLVMAACSSLLADLTPCCVMKVLRTPVSVFWGYLDTSNAAEFEI